MRTAAGMSLLLVILLGACILSGVVGALLIGKITPAEQEAIRVQSTLEQQERGAALRFENAVKEGSLPEAIGAAKDWAITQKLLLRGIAAACVLGALCIVGYGYMHTAHKGVEKLVTDVKDLTCPQVIEASDGTGFGVAPSPWEVVQGKGQSVLDVPGGQRVQAQIGVAREISGALAAGSPQAEPAGRGVVFQVADMLMAPFQGPSTQIVPLGRRLPSGPVRPQDEDAVLNSLGPEFDQALGHASGVEIVDDEGGE